MSTAIWQPTDVTTTNMYKFMTFVQQKYDVTFANYTDLQRWSVKYIDKFWQSLCEYMPIHFDSPPKKTLNQYASFLEARWFEGATLNFAKALLARHDNHPALVCWTEQGHTETLSYSDLNKQVAQCVQGLQNAGVKAGDRVVGILPNTAYPIIAMLATTAIGAIWSSCSPDFGVKAIIDRLEQIQPSLLFICDGYQYQGKPFDTYAKIDKMIGQLPSVTNVVLCPVLYNAPTPLPKPIIEWQDFLPPEAAPYFESLPFDHPVYILFSSGTTGQPKCIVHGAGGTLLQHVKELSLHTNIHPDDKMLFFTTCGWMMWNWMVSTLALGATLVLYEGAPTYPDAAALFHIIEQEKVNILGAGAKLIATVAHEGIIPKERYNLKTLRCILSTASPLLPKHYDFIQESIGANIQVSSISGGTDIVSCFALGNPMTPVYRGELQSLGLGMAVDIYNDHGKSIKQTQGELVCTKPFPSMPVYFWNDPDKTRYHATYFEHFHDIWTHGDLAELTEHGGLIIYGRSDTTLNPNGIRIGTAEIYRQLEYIPQITDSVVITQDWDDDVRIVLFITLKDGLILDETLEKTIRQTLRANASPRHVPAKILQVPDIPRTINGKVVELAVRNAVHEQPISNLNSLANPEALKYFKHRAELQE